MIRRLALAAGFAVLGAVAVTPKAHGQAAPASETVPFEATLGSTCTLSNPLQGDLVEAGDLLTSDPLEGGARGKIDVECTGNNTVSVAAPVEVSVPAGLSTIAGSEQAMLFDGGAEIANSGTSTTPSTTGSVAAGNVTLEVQMQVIQDGTGFPPGLYQYDVEVTATPN